LFEMIILSIWKFILLICRRFEKAASIFFASVLFLAVVPVEAARVRFFSVSAYPPKVQRDVASNGTIEARGDAQFVKVSVVLDSLVDVRKVRVESCGGIFQDGVDFYFYPRWKYAFAEGGKQAVEAQLAREDSQVRTISINFRHNNKVCLKGLWYSGPDQKLVPLEIEPPTPAVLDGARGLSRLFDGIIDTVYDLSGAGAKLSFNVPQSFDRGRVWLKGRGARPSKIELKGDGEFSEVVQLEDDWGGQEVRFKKPFKGRNLFIRGIDGGEVAEIRFSGEAGTIRPHTDEENEAMSVRNRIAEAGLIEILDRELGTREDGDRWQFRFRSDGTFFIRGFTDEDRTSRAYSALGSFEVISGSPRPKLRLVGSRMTTAFPWDGIACPLGCGDRGAPPGKLVGEEIEIEKLRGAAFMIRNRTLSAERTLHFSDLKVKASSLHE
jgi:hypothetical protein